MRLIVITGATATGKTRMAVEAAHALGSEIVSADSRQVYRGLDIGTGKDLDEYAAVSPAIPYHLIDVADPSEIYTLFHFQRDCYQVISECRSRAPFAQGTPLVIAGGTPLYLASVLLSYEIPNVPGNLELRLELEERTLDELVVELERMAPDIHARTDLSAKRRVIRSLEVAHHAVSHTVVTTPPLSFELETEVFATRIDREVLHRRIGTRLDERLQHGMVDEVQGLLEAGVSRQRMDELGLEYRQVAAYLSGDKSYDEMAHELAKAIHRFARRQEVWLRSFPRRGIPLTWVEPGDGETIRRQVVERWGLSWPAE